MFSKIFNVFSRRESLKETGVKPLSPEFRNRVIMLLQDELGFSFNDMLATLQRKLAYLHGKFQLADSRSGSSHLEDVINFLMTCKDEYFLDAIELIFCSNINGVSWPDNALIPSINEFLRVDNLPYHLTGYVVEKSESLYRGTPATSIEISEFPKIIRRDNELVYKKALEPALEILSGKEFKHANQEFLAALEDHRKGDYRDCLTKCGSAFESTMKVLCKKTSISFKETDTASTLIKALLKNGQLDGYWEQPLILIATIRNRLSSSHGAGTKAKEPSEHVASYVINSTAAAVILLYKEFCYINT